MSKVDYLEILRLWAMKYSKNRISNSVHISHHTVEDVIDAAAAAGIAWPLESDITNDDIQEILFPGRYAFASPYTMPDFQYIHEELAKKGVTLTLLWEEYFQKVRATDGVPYMYTQFCEKYRRWARVTKATMRISHKPGDAMQVDWAGDPLYITDPVTGELSPAYIQNRSLCPYARTSGRVDNCKSRESVPEGYEDLCQNKSADLG